MKIIFAIQVLILVVFFLNNNDNNYDNTVQSKSTYYVSLDEYSKCKRSTETQLIVFNYKSKYPNVSDEMIAHIICNK